MLWKINNMDTVATWGAYILADSYKDIMSPPAVKERLEHDFADEHGMRVDAAGATYSDEKKYKINVLIVGTNFGQFWARYDAFFFQIMKLGAWTLWIEDLGVTVTLLYESAKCTKKPRRLKSGRVAVSYEVSVKEYNPNLRVYDSN